MKIENDKLLLNVALEGGAYTDFHLKEFPVNPVNWKTDNPEHPPLQGHFLCFDRWGPPAEAEKTLGIPLHGEVNLQTWKLLSGQNKNRKKVRMACNLPIANLRITRTIGIPGEESVFKVNEKIENLNTGDKLYNIVQHVTIAPPFLDPSVIIDTNAGKGFINKLDGSLSQDNVIINWPKVVHSGYEIDLRQFKSERPLLASFVFNEVGEYGWVTACNPSLGLLFGYLWRTGDYPWINFWSSMANGVPLAFGMEFGTTGLHEDFSIVTKKGKILGQSLYEVIEAGGIVEKSFFCFIVKVAKGFKGVAKINYNNSFIEIKERNEFSNNVIILNTKTS